MARAELGPKAGQLCRPAHILLVILLALYALITVDQLSTLPPVHHDEPWIAAPAHKLATTGVYGFDPLSGYYNADRHYVMYPPVYTLVQAGIFAALGSESVTHLRLASVLFGALLLVGSYLVGREIHDDRTGILAVLLLVFLRLGTGTEATGMLFLDAARWARPDIAVAGLGVVAFWLFERAERAQTPASYLVTGLVIGLSSLAHLYGVFWLGALWMVILLRRGFRSLVVAPGLFLLIGALIPWLPWLLVLAGVWQDYLGQLRLASGRFALLDPEFYLRNLLNEPERWKYLDLRTPSGRPYLLRPGVWVTFIAVPWGVARALRSALMRTNKRPHYEFSRSFDLAVVAVAHVAMLALLIDMKSRFYTIVVWPPAVLIVAWLGVDLWDRRGRWMRGALVLAVFFVVVEGLAQVAERRQLARNVTPYSEITKRLDRHIPVKARLLAPTRYWWGLRHRDFRSWVLPIILSNSVSHHDPMDFDVALGSVAPDIVIVDAGVRDFLGGPIDPEHPVADVPRKFWNYMRRREAAMIGVVESETYGRLEIFRLEAESDNGES